RVTAQYPRDQAKLDVGVRKRLKEDRSFNRHRTTRTEVGEPEGMFPRLARRGQCRSQSSHLTRVRALVWVQVVQIECAYDARRLPTLCDRFRLPNEGRQFWIHGHFRPWRRQVFVANDGRPIWPIWR